MFQVAYLKVASDFVKCAEGEPNLFLTTQSDAFGRPLLEEITLKSLRITNCSMLANLNERIVLLSTSSLAVMSRQLSRYLTGPLANPSNEMKLQATSAPLHNIWAERTLGKVDSLVKRASNAEITFIDSVSKVKANHSVDWLLTKTFEEREKLVSFCIKRGVQARKTGKERQLRNEKVLIERIKEKGQKRDMKRRNKLGKEIKQGLMEGLTVDDKLFDSVTGHQREMLHKFFEENLKSLEGVEIEHV